MRKIGILLLAGVLAVAGAGLVVRAQDLPRTPGAVERYVPMQPAIGVLDTLSGALYYVDPADRGSVVTLDMPGARAFLRDVAKDASGWGAVELPKMDPAVVPPARGHVFMVVGAYEVCDTRTGAIYSLEAPPAGKVSEWKAVKVVRTDPVLGTRVVRDMHLSKRGS